jgi:hypothetical protein
MYMIASAQDYVHIYTYIQKYCKYVYHPCANLKRVQCVCIHILSYVYLYNVYIYNIYITLACMSCDSCLLCLLCAWAYFYVSMYIHMNANTCIHMNMFFVNHSSPWLVHLCVRYIHACIYIYYVTIVAQVHLLCLCL